MTKQREQFFFGHGKVLLSSEYFVLDGAEALALPTILGQTLTVRYRNSFEPKLIWKSYDSEGKVWFDSEFELWRFDVLSDSPKEEELLLQKILVAARELNPHFLREELEIIVETKLDFPTNWGLGSSSSLIYNIAQWAYVSPFELAMNTTGGSGYDIACAGSMGPILFQKRVTGPSWKQIDFFPYFHENLYFVYQGKKVSTASEVEIYQNLDIKNKTKIVNELSHITNELVQCHDIKEFDSLILAHENIISNALDKPRVLDEKFSDYWGAVKSLGAWGGDFILVSSQRSQKETAAYFASKGLNTFISFSEIICRNYKYNVPESLRNPSQHDHISQ